MTHELYEARSAARQHLFPHFTKAGVWSDPQLPIIVRGEGCYLIDQEGRSYLDGLSGLFCTNLGYGRTELVQAATAQMEQLPYWTNWGSAHPAAIEAATRIAQLAPEGLNTVFFANSGSEANESAIKFARQYHLSQGQGQRTKIIARNMAYHGTTMGALALTGLPQYKATSGPLMPEVYHAPNTLGEAALQLADPSQLPSIQGIEALIAREGAQHIAALIMEPVQCSRGVLVPPPGYAQQVRRICDEHGILLIMDEVICGFGRMGAWFGSQRYGFTPDVITFAKGITSGYAPLGGMVIRDELAQQLMDSPQGGIFMHGATWGGHPVSTAVACATLKLLEQERIPERVRSLEGFLQQGLAAIVAEYDCLLEWRGTGFLYALEFVASRAQNQQLEKDQSEQLLGSIIPRALRESGVITRPDNRGATMLVLAPPLVAGEAVLAELLDAVRHVARSVQRHLSEQPQPVGGP